MSEVARIREQAVGVRFTQLESDQATTASVLTAMKQHSSVHLACHAIQDITDPTASGFQLYDGILNLGDITKESSTRKGLAFLSACQTATGDPKLPNEAVHLAAGMLVAGYSSVIATMWSIKDQDAPLVAEKVYGQLLKSGKLDTTGAAKALHDAVGMLRATIGDQAFSRWVPYIHLGI
jgi:CHAT domain-containing protein